MKISEIITDKYKLRMPPTVYYDLLADVVEAEEEQELCDNAISRQAVLDLVVANHTELNGLNVVMYSPLYKDIKQLPPVTPKPKTGHWEVVSDEYGDSAYICECSECKDTVWVYKEADRKWNYCPNCGADMRGEE